MPITASEFQYVADLVRDQAAIDLPAGKEYLVEARLGPVAREEGFPSVQVLLQDLMAAPSSSTPLHDRVVEAMATHETYFFREPRAFQLLKKKLLPDLIERRSAEKKLRFWSAACATGQEAYSLAILLEESFPELADWNVTILGTDLSPRALESARTGEYSQYEVNRGLSARHWTRFFDRDGLDWRLKNVIRKRVRFRQLNLSRPFPALPRMDIILLRNVLIYFTPEAKEDVLKRMAPLLRRDGLLFLGGSESMANLDLPYERHHEGKATWYERAR